MSKEELPKDNIKSEPHIEDSKKIKPKIFNKKEKKTQKTNGTTVLGNYQKK